MATSGLRRLLVSRNLVVLLLAVGAVALAAAALLRGLAEEEALARVQLAGVSAELAVEGSLREVEGASALLAERPGLGRLFAAGDLEGTRAFLERFRVASRLSGCGLMRDGMWLASAGALVDPPKDSEAIGVTFHETNDPERPLLVAAWSDYSAMRGLRVVTIRALDTRAAQAIAQGLGVGVALLGAKRVSSSAGGQVEGLRTRAILEHVPQSRRLRDGSFVAVHPLVDDGAVTMLVEARLDAQSVRGPLRHFLLWLGALALLVSVVASISSATLARRLGVELDALTRAAATIKEGNLSVPVPHVAPGEIATLGETMDAMRRALLQTTAEVRRRESEARSMIDGIVEGVFTVDRDRRILDLNTQTANLLGIELDAAKGKFCGDVLDPVGADGTRPCEHDCPILTARLRGQTSAVEHLRRSDGTWRSVVITSAMPIEGRQFQLMRDETDVEAARRARDAVLANISHEFRTPLSAQLASLELLLDQVDDLAPSETRELLQSLHRGALRLTQLIDNLLESVRIESGQTSLRRQSVRLDEVVEEAVEMVRPLSALREQTLVFEIDGPLVPIDADGGRLRQVVVNLLANAQKFAPAGTAVTVRVGMAGEEAWVCVEDEGPGWPAGFATSSIAPFHRGGSGEPVESGVGLGLWIARSIVQRHGGRLELTMRGGRTIATLRVPIEADADSVSG
ncbi:MAG: ATP-binding protein [Acidobacteriota bacterium]